MRLERQSGHCLSRQASWLWLRCSLLSSATSSSHRYNKRQKRSVCRRPSLALWWSQSSGPPRKSHRPSRRRKGSSRPERQYCTRQRSPDRAFCCAAVSRTELFRWTCADEPSVLAGCHCDDAFRDYGGNVDDQQWAIRLVCGRHDPHGLRDLRNDSVPAPTCSMTMEGALIEVFCLHARVSHRAFGLPRLSSPRARRYGHIRSQGRIFSTT